MHLNKGEFIGRDALTRWQQQGFYNRFVTFEAHDTNDGDVLGNNPVAANGDVVGRATGGNFGFRPGKSLALAMVPPYELGEPGTELSIDVLGDMHPATVVDESPYDPGNERLRG